MKPAPPVIFPVWNKHCRRHWTACLCSAHSGLFTKSAPSNLKSKRLWFRVIIRITSTPLYLKELACPTTCYGMKRTVSDGWTILGGLFNRAETTFPLSLQKRGHNFEVYSVCGRETDLRVGILLLGTVISEHHTGVEVQLQAFVGFAFDGSEWVAAGSGRLTPSGPRSRSKSSSKKKTARLPRI
jgi:hypothetical protein